MGIVGTYRAAHDSHHVPESEVSVRGVFALAASVALVACGGEAASPSSAEANTKAGRGELRRCYQEAFTANPNPDGRIVVRVQVAPDGSVLSMEVGERSGNLSDATAQCVVDPARVLRWEASGCTDVRNVSFTIRKEK